MLRMAEYLPKGCRTHISPAYLLSVYEVRILRGPVGILLGRAGVWGEQLAGKQVMGCNSCQHARLGKVRSSYRLG